MKHILSIAILVCLASTTQAKPNIIWIMADDLGYGDIGCYGQKKIRTPSLDRMAKEGLRFTQFYAGATVCAPSRSVLMTGQHTGRTWVRGNAGRKMEIQSLRDRDITVAEMLKKAGYQTALCGKWGLGDVGRGASGLPNRQGFDHFYGYLNQVHAHNYYPEFLWRNRKKVMLRNVVKKNGRGYGGFRGGYATKRVDYSHDLVMKEAQEWIQKHHQKPFFLYLALTIPHANNEGTRGTKNGQEVPDYGIYAKKNWAAPDKGQAAMITRMDADVGRLMELLKKLGVARNTLVIFTSDNGHHREGGNRPEFFDANGPLNGMKRNLTEGGIRVPTIAWWPGTIKANRTSDHIGYFGDLMATACDIAKVDLPKPSAGMDSISFLPTLEGKSDKQQQHKYLYWEFYERGSKQAVRFGKWKAIRKPMFTGNVQLFDLSKDIGEKKNIAQQHPGKVKEAIAYMKQAHVPNANWKVRK